MENPILTSEQPIDRLKIFKPQHEGVTRQNHSDTTIIHVLKDNCQNSTILEAQLLFHMHLYKDTNSVQGL